MKSAICWTIAILITLAAIFYQKVTGPTYAKKTGININGASYRFNLPRSHGGDNPCIIDLQVSDTAVTARLEYRKFPTNDAWEQKVLDRQGNDLITSLPHQPPAGKLEYRITLEKNNRKYLLNEGNSVIIRFKGDVPGAVLIPHIFFMFFAMLLSNLAGIMVLFNHKKYIFYGKLTLAVLFLGGLILGPWVQWYAFGEAWTGVPFAWDLTDNKTLVAFIFWGLAVIMNRKHKRPAYIVAASLIMLIVYSIPHSMFGSELNPETGKIIQGWITFCFRFI